MKIELPQSVKVCLWSYDTNQIDLAIPDHRVRIIRNVLDRGTKEAVDWLLNTFDKSEIAEVISETSVSDWSRKSLSLWSLVFNTYPTKKGRFI